MAGAEHTVVVTSVQHYTDRLFRFRTTRPRSFRFDSGQFIMLGLEVDGKPIMRAYSMANPKWDDELEFFSIKVPDGPLTSRLQYIQIDDSVLMSAKAVGSLTTKSLISGKRLFLISTGTGIAPFSSIVRDPDVYDEFDEIILTHTCRLVSELQYGYEVIEQVKTDPLCAAFAPKLTHYTTTTREPYEYEGRITHLIENGKFFTDIEAESFNPEEDRVMICGSIDFIKDMQNLLEKNGFQEGSTREPGAYVLERAFVG